MSIGILELNDSGLRFSQGSEHRFDSPGVAVMTEHELLLGERAQRQARLQPLQTNNQFWQRLDQEPLPNATARYRHHADLAFNHLREIQQLADGIHELIFSVPGHFNRQQLSLLLGIVQACDFSAAGLVDSATAALAPRVGRGTFLHVDIHLHQTLITELRAEESLVRTGVETLPGIGLAALYDAWAKLLAQEFVRHTRFDPLHRADTEQQLYDALPDFLEQCRRTGEAKLSLAEHQISLTAQALQEPVAALYQRIQQKLNQPCDQIFLSDRWQSLPGFGDSLSNSTSPVSLLPRNAVAEGCTHYEAQIRGSGDTLNFITQLPLTASSQASASLSTRPSATPAVAAATSAAANALLYRHHAHPVPSSLYLHSDASALGLSATKNDTALCEIQNHNGQLRLHPINGSAQSASELQLNNRPARDGDTLHCGDTLTLPGLSEGVAAIHIHPGAEANP